MPGSSNDSASGAKHGAGTYQMLWDCRFCGTEKLLGITHRHCPNCGAAQDPERRYFPEEDAMVALEDHRYVGTDRICPACGQPNSAASSYCSECGAELASGQEVQTQFARELGLGAAEGDTRRDVVEEKFKLEMAQIQGAQRQQATLLGISRRNWIVALIVLLLLVCIGVALFALFYRAEASGEVSDLVWERTIEIQSFQAVSETAWEDQLPGDAYGKSCDRRQRDTRRVADGSHEECRDVDQGDGSFRRECETVTDYRDEPVYDMWCSYTVDRWVFERKVSEEGRSRLPGPQWPQLTLASAAGRFGEERAGDRHESYFVVVRDGDGDTHRCSFYDQAAWERFDVGARVSFKTYVTGGVDCGSLEVLP